MPTFASPVSRWPGTVALPDYLTLPQIIEWNEAIERAGTYTQETEDGKRVVITDAPRYYITMLKPVCSIVLDWQLRGLGALTPETFPGTPVRSAQKLMRWLVDSVAELMAEEAESPPA